MNTGLVTRPLKTMNASHACMVLEIPRRQARWQPLDMGRAQGVGLVAKRPLQHRPELAGVTLRAHPQPVVEITFRPKVLRGNEHAPAAPERARKARLVASRSSATRTHVVWRSAE
jgi:hypothetical protein